MKDTLLLYANYYHNLGMNITHLQGVQENSKSFKDPTDCNWDYYFDNNQSISYILGQNWELSTGIGLITGYNGYRAIDIDYLHNDYGLWMLFQDDRDKLKQCSFWDFLYECLKILGLPKDYPWVVLSGSHEGIHIIFKTDDVEGVDFDSVSYSPNEEYIRTINEGFAGERFFRNMELRWKDHLVLPPSTHINGKKYEFLYDLPNIYPMRVKINALNDFFNHYSGRTRYIPFYNRSFYLPEFYLVQRIKTYSKFDSWGYPRILKEDNKQWLCKCSSADAINSLGIEAVKEDNINKAIQYFRQSDNDMAHYNIATLIVHANLSHLEDELDYHLLQIGKLDSSKLKEEIQSYRNRDCFDLP